MAVYGVCIFVANFQLAIRFNTHTLFSTLALLAGVVAYFLFYGLASKFLSGQVDHLFIPTFKIQLLYVCIFFCLAQTYVIDVIYGYFMGKYTKFRNEKLVREMKAKAKKSMRATNKLMKDKKKKDNKIKGKP